MRRKMFSSLKLNSLKCQSNSGSESKKNKFKGDNEDDASDHMYEKLPGLENSSSKCHLDQIKRFTKPSKTSFSKRISKWKMECPSKTNIQSTPIEENFEAKNIHQEGRIREILNLERTVKAKVITVNVERECGTLGITLRGGFQKNSDLSTPVIITYVKPDGPAAKLGTIKPGDRLLAVDGISLQGSTLNDAQALLKQPSTTALLTIEYDVNVLEAVERAHGPLLVEIEKSSTQQLGLTLCKNEDGIIIERVKPGSLADRCGALHGGDEILAINLLRIDDSSITLKEVINLLDSDSPTLKLEILPSFTLSCGSNYGTWKAKEYDHSFTSTLSGGNTLKADGHRKSDQKKDERGNGLNSKPSHINSLGFYGSEVALTHSERLHTTLTRENGSFGLTFIDAPDGSIQIHSITPDSPAERSQCLHPGDRILSINRRNIDLDNLTAQDINNLLELKSSGLKLNLQTEFNVLDTIEPSRGIFIVKLVKRGSSGLGITMTASKSSGFVISELKKGSIAHRAGSLIPGDKLLAINNLPLDECSLEYATQAFKQSANIVTLKVHRLEDNSHFRSCRKITYTLDLQRYGGPLGITIAGSEEPFHPITISGLTVGGLAERTGVIHIGDEILAINNHSLFGEPLSKAHILLQNSPDLVTLKLSRSLIPVCSLSNNRSPVLPSSIDSAVESWDSSHIDLASPSDHQKSHRECVDGGRQNLSTHQWKSVDTDFLGSTTENTNEICTTNSNEIADASLSILDEITSENMKIKRELDLLTEKLDERIKCKSLQNECSNISNQNEDNFQGYDSEKFLKVQPQSQSADKLRPEGTKSKLRDLYGETNSINNVINDVEKEYGIRESLLTNIENLEMTYMPETRNWCKNHFLRCEGSQGSIRSEFLSSQLYEVTLYKDPIYEDFGFSVSDGLYEKGVFINRIRKGGPADLSNILKPYDRILQVNQTYTQDFDCCLTVPLIASAGDSLVLLVARNPANYNMDDNVWVITWQMDFYNEGLQNKSITPPAKLSSNDHEEVRRILV